MSAPDRFIIVGQLDEDDETCGTYWGTSDFAEVVSLMRTRVARGDRFEPDDEVLELTVARRCRISDLGVEGLGVSHP